MYLVLLDKDQHDSLRYFLQLFLLQRGYHRFAEIRATTRQLARKGGQFTRSWQQGSEPRGMLNEKKGVTSSLRHRETQKWKQPFKIIDTMMPFLLTSNGTKNKQWSGQMIQPPGTMLRIGVITASFFCRTFQVSEGVRNCSVRHL